MSDQNTKLTSLLKTSNEFLGFIVGIITSVIFLLTQIDKTNKLITEERVLIFVDILNIAILLIGVLSIKGVELSIESQEIKKVEKHLGIEKSEEFNNILDRTNELIKQLAYSVRWFVIVLGLFYLLQLFVDTTQPSYKLIKETLNSSKSFIELISDNSPYRVLAAKYLTIEFLTNATNLFSAAYLFLAFQVLFLRTLSKDNKTWRLKGYIPFSIAILITVANFLFILVGIGNSELISISHMVRLTGGIYNGVAMLLLFSRFISMEYFFQYSKKKWQRNFYFYGTIIGLPLYVIAQPLYGLFNAVEIGNSAVLFKSLVFLVCFWGKLIFLLFVYTMLKKKWIHSYIFMVLSQKETINNLSKDVAEIEDI